MSLLFMQRCERRSYNPVPCDDSNDNYDVVAVVVVVAYLAHTAQEGPLG